MLAEDHGFVQDATDIVNDVLEKDTEVTEWTFTTYGNYTMGVKDIPTIGFGPAHEKHVAEPDEQSFSRGHRRRYKSIRGAGIETLL